MNSASSCVSAFGTLLTLDASTLDDTPVLIGTLLENPATLFIFNDSTVPVFISDNNGSTKGLSLIAGRAVTIDVVANKGGSSDYFTWRKGTQFYATGSSGSGTINIGLNTAL